MDNKPPRGRPPTFSREQRHNLAELIRQHGISGARRRAKFPICHQTLSRIAREFDVTLSKGRRPKSAA